MQVKIENIIIKERARKNPGDVKLLMESMEKYGQLNPIILNSKMQLVAGYRRLEAAKRLGWEKINAAVIEIPNKADMLAIEIEENIRRLDFAPEDLNAACKKLKKLQSRGFFRRIWNAVVNFLKKIFKPKRSLF